jgi:phosphoenolpyruvate---glycerone phosphotransferase subunit DhaL
MAEGALVGEQTVDAAAVRTALLAISEAVQAAKDQLTELDAAVGDGDMGVNLNVGFKAVAEALQAMDTPETSQLLAKAGMTIANTAPSTIGILLASALLAAGKEVKGKGTLTLDDVARMTQAAARAIQDRGKAKVGDKTILEALVPAADALTAAAQEGISLQEGLSRAVAAAETGMKATVAMQSRIGRASWIGERTVGHQDAGATLCYVILKAVADSAL